MSATPIVPFSTSLITTIPTIDAIVMYTTIMASTTLVHVPFPYPMLMASTPSSSLIDTIKGHDMASVFGHLSPILPIGNTLPIIK